MTQAARLRSSQTVVDDSPEAINDHFYNERMTDGLPIVPPTPDRVARFIDASGRDASSVIGEIAPAWGKATVEKIAVNAVMAGCLPEYVPILIAAVQGMCEPDFNLHGIQTCTGFVGPMLVINGPIRHELKINCGASVLGPGSRPNATMGRAIRFILNNVGGATPGDVDKSTMGWPGKYGMCIGENEEQSPWAPFHVDQGFKAEESCVTVIGAEASWQITDITPWPESVAHHLGHTFIRLPLGRAHGPGNEGEDHSSGPTLLLNPVFAKMMAVDLGHTKESFKRFLWEKNRYPAEWAPKTHPWVEPIDGNVPVAVRPDLFRIFVAGSDSGYHAMALSALMGPPMTKKVET